jgi:two-component system chemotaxis sensor kinase CheA
MDVSEYLPMFLAEAREHLQELNLAVVKVEESPDDRETIDEIFRAAHSLKGMSATMGFPHIAALTHEMEDVFEMLKQRTEGLSREAIDVLLECLDALSAAVESIDVEGVEKLDEEPLCHRLQALIRVQDAADDTTATDAAASAAAAGAIPAEVIERADGRRIVHVVAQLSPDSPMPAVRAFQLIAALGDHGDLLGSMPTEEEIDGFGEHTVQVWLTSEHEDDVVLATALGVSEVVSATVDALGSAANAPAPAAAPAPAPAPVAADVAPEPEREADATERAAATEAPAAAAAPAAQAAKAPAAKGKPSATVRVDAERLDQLMHLMGELVVRRTTVESFASKVDIPDLQHAMQELTRASQALQHMVMQVRMIPVEAVFLRFPRLVRDLSSKLDKQVELVLTGQDTELDRTVVDALGDPLVHIVRNSLDHGLEPAADRIAAGKPATGTLEISAYHAGGNVVISVRDDGRGIDPKRVARKAAEKGLIPLDAVDSIDMPRAIELLFAPGFSTHDVATDISGRGVGMDAVRTSIRELGGEATLISETGKGTTAQIRLPLTLAIMAALLVETDGIPFAIPLDRVERTLRLEDHPVRSVAGAPMLMLRDGVLPLLDLAGSLGYPASSASTHAVVARAGDVRLALAVESLVGQRELVTRPLPDEVGDAVALSGGAVLSNGEIALIVDCDALAENAGATLNQLAA